MPIPTNHPLSTVPLSDFYDSYAPIIFGLISKILPAELEKETAFTATFLYLSEHVKDYNPAQGTFINWLTGQARRIAVEIYYKSLFNDVKTNPFCDRPIIEKTILSLHYLKAYSGEQISDFLLLPIAPVTRVLKTAPANSFNSSQFTVC